MMNACSIFTNSLPSLCGVILSAAVLQAERRISRYIFADTLFPFNEASPSTILKMNFNFNLKDIPFATGQSIHAITNGRDEHHTGKYGIKRYGNPFSFVAG
jgi:hypothetical protein